MVILILITSLSSFAREKLNIDPYFEKESISSPGVSVIKYQDMEIDGHRLKEYRSITVTGNKVLADRLRAAVSKDGVNAEAKETSYKAGELYFGFYSLGGKAESKRYILYLNRRPLGEEKSTLIFMEGDVDMKFVRKILKLK